MIFLTLFLLLLIGSATLVFWGLILPASTIYSAVFWVHSLLYAAAAIAFGVVFSSRVRGRRRSESGIDYWSGAYFFSFLGLHSLYFAATLLFSILLLIPGIPLGLGALASLGFAYFLALLGLLVSYQGPKLVHVDLKKGAVETLKILQISDLHIGASVGASYVRNLVTKCLAVHPDCIVLTGDIGDGDPGRHENAILELAKLKAPLGVFLVLGNHEFLWPTEKWIAAFRSCGFSVLQDEKIEIPLSDSKLTLIGLSPIARWTIPKTSGTSVVLAHYPNRAADAAKAGASLFLAGHTHGGQFWPWSWVIYLFHRFAKGHYKIDQTDVYVSCGSGHWGPPFRFGQRSEITLIELGLTQEKK